ncbi:hypothetical protein [Almyronema epifaneia]|uniref:Uncharacterized protein n=1 Tax=Almyronema epifaneia S1 TaxID=2991925 RepID=A0ABW6ID61_9CYAN
MNFGFLSAILATRSFLQTAISPSAVAQPPTLAAWLLYLPLPASSADWGAFIFFGGILGLIAWQVYHTRER